MWSRMIADTPWLRRYGAPLLPDCLTGLHQVTRSLPVATASSSPTRGSFVKSRALNTGAALATGAFGL